MSVSLYPGFNKPIQLEIAKAEEEAALTSTAPNSTSIVNYAINLPHTQIMFHTLMKILSGSFCIFVILVALFLIASHFTHWAVPAEHRLVRVIAFLPVYATGAFISIYLYRIRPHGYSERNLPPQRKPFPTAVLRSFIGLVFLSSRSYQAELPLLSRLRYFTPLLARSQTLQYGLLIIQVVQAFSTNFAVVAVIGLVSVHNSRLQGRHPRLKLWTFKSVVFLEFIQNVVFSALAATQAYRPTQYVSCYGMSIELNQFITAYKCFFAFLEVINPMDIIRETLAAFSFFRNVEPSEINTENGMVATNGTYDHVKDEAQIRREPGLESLV
ncbi:uncharacterized protein PAC_11308 [Phialocephala subalpina]|uniref:Uncharacterized protein n=1 Tax=Phialocephala subalpina TaxID=576137 RepID=A0A1L7X8S6_9HELO|nr:uncharacterized protein PAC_11308 [Phialocephala subalpina]